MKSVLTWDYDLYSPEVLKWMDEKELRAEYSKLRSIARKRLERLGESEFASSQVYRQYSGKFNPTPELKSKAEVARKLSAVATFLNKQASSVRGMKEYRRNAISSLHQSGFSWINSRNFSKFTDFMEYNRQLRQGGLMDSERVAEVVKFADRQKLDSNDLKNNFEWWVNNIDEAKAVSRKMEQGADAAKIRNKIIADKRSATRRK